MNLTLQRSTAGEGCTIGALLVDGLEGCFTCEDVVREIPGIPVSAWKVAGETAIPAGNYQVIITPSVRFKRELPLLVNVPGFAGVRIHPGNTAEDTEGCILVGTRVGVNSVLESRIAFTALFERIKNALDNGELCHIEIRNPG